ncbi:hypothetical protein [Halobacillus sp. K22]|uniref:hypothetical protein n=1 Tax=Halobacillus sp. K22 TaxID=3457431 RepID=UPI003FCD452C
MNETEYESLQEATGVNTESQGLYIRNSQNIDVTQTEVQTLVLVQSSLAAVIEAAILTFDSQVNSRDTSKLEKLAEDISAVQVQNQNIVIEYSEGITVRQTEVQTEVIVQTAIEIIAKLLAELD